MVLWRAPSTDQTLKVKVSRMSTIEATGYVYKRMIRAIKFIMIEISNTYTPT